jgi:hypothetical protein
VAKPQARDPRKFASQVIRTVVLATEELMGARCITSFDGYRPRDPVRVGGMCSCCGASGRVDGPDDWWLVMRAGFNDPDGVFMSMLCVGPDGSGCFTEIREDSKKRPPSLRDLAAAEISDLLGDDVDGAESLMDDLDYLGMLDE